MGGAGALSPLAGAVPEPRRVLRARRGSPGREPCQL